MLSGRIASDHQRAGDYFAEEASVEHPDHVVTIGRDPRSSGPSHLWTEALTVEDTPLTPDRTGSVGPRWAVAGVEDG